MAEGALPARSAAPGRIGLARLRQTFGLAAFLTLLAFLPGGNPLPDVRARLGTLRLLARHDLRARRLAGSSAGYDRRFFEFVLAAREALPPGSKGVALYAPGIPEWGGLYLTIYHFAPVPVIVAPARVPVGWVAAVYGQYPPPNLRLVRPLPGGALFAPP